MDRFQKEKKIKCVICQGDAIVLKIVDESRDGWTERLFELAYEDFNRNLEKLRKLYPVKTVCMHGSLLSKISNLDLGPSGIRFAVIGMNSTG